ncbi:class I SAM-dependent methyltransferase [Amycolatopsis sp. NPDC004625]|uniref:class I SAM-dependent methyltransferase n=1 Tax=Amycolatopsis sp. NPDC004625 TaxID=3154670 RepID=UPI0033A3F0D7
MSEARRIVESGYDRVAERYLEWSARIPDDPRLRFLGELTGRLAGGARVLDLGCGAGVPCTAALAEEHDVLGVDVSATQLDLARRNVPGARFERADMTGLSFPDGSFDAVTAFYSVLHVPREGRRRSTGCSAGAERGACRGGGGRTGRPGRRSRGQSARLLTARRARVRSGSDIAHGAPAYRELPDPMIVRGSGEGPTL